MKRSLLILLVLLFCTHWVGELYAVEAFGPALIRVYTPGHGVASLRFASPDDKDTSDTSGQAKGADDTEVLHQQQLNTMLTQSSMFDAVPPTESQEKKATDFDLYNAAPLFTGAVVTVFSIAFTAYLIYAGITGDDPMTGHPIN